MEEVVGTLIFEELDGGFDEATEFFGFGGFVDFEALGAIWGENADAEAIVWSPTCLWRASPVSTGCARTAIDEWQSASSRSRISRSA